MTDRGYKNIHQVSLTISPKPKTKPTCQLGVVTKDTKATLLLGRCATCSARAANHARNARTENHPSSGQSYKAGSKGFWVQVMYSSFHN